MLLVLSLGIALSAAANATTLSSTVNRNQVSTNETLTLTVAIDEQVDSSLLDLAPLQENFEILSASPQSRSSFNMINGRSEKSASTTWAVTLVAKNEGILTIPSFTIKSAKSKPISIKVSNAKSNSNSNRALDVKVTSSAKEVYPNQQIIVEIELSARRNVRDLNGPQLVLPNADVQAFDQQNFQRVDNGIARQVVVLKYSVFAKQAGELTIPVMTYTGLENARRSLFGANGTQVIARSKPINITVKDAPISNGQQWFPAQDVSIKSTWSGDISTLKVGEPITRTVTITAKAQLASAIPPLEQPPLVADLKSYRDQPQLDTAKSTQGFVSTRIESEAIVANQAGAYVLPEISLSWWNTNTKKWQTSVIEAQTLNVSGVAETVDNSADRIDANTPIVESNPSGDSTPNTLWQLVSAGLAIIVLIQFYLLIRKPAPNPKPASTEKKNQSEKACWSALQRALKSNNGHEIRSALLDWGRVMLNTQNPLSLDALAQAGVRAGCVEEDLQPALTSLDRHLFAGGKMPNRDVLTKELAPLRTHLKKSIGSSQKAKPALNQLYPD